MYLYFFFIVGCSTSGYTTGIDGNGYKLYDQQVNFEAAKQSCLDNGAELAVVQNDNEMAINVIFKLNQNKIRAT